MIKQKLCLNTAHKLKFACLYVSRKGPDVVDAAMCTWLNVGVPTILYGCEVIPFTETLLQELKRVQAQVAKSILGVPKSTANICAQTELGMKPFRQLVYELQLNFYSRVLLLPPTRWVRCALLEHMSGTWDSPYLAYISEIRSKTGAINFFVNKQAVRIQCMDFFLDWTNREIMSLSLPAVSPVRYLSRLPYVCEGTASSTISQFRLANAGLGNRFPVMGRARQKLCPVGPKRPPVMVLNSEFHLVAECPGVGELRERLGITRFFNLSRLNGYGPHAAFKLFLEGLDEKGSKVEVSVFLVRVRKLADLRDAWITVWSGM